MRYNPKTLSGITPATPLTPREMVSDDMLRRLARDTPERAYGEISADDQRELAMILPDICAELLARRAAAKCAPAHSQTPARHPATNIGE